MLHSSLTWQIIGCLSLVACGSGGMQATGGSSSSSTGAPDAGTGTGGAGGTGATTSTTAGTGAASTAASTSASSAQSSSGSVLDGGGRCLGTGPVAFPAAYRACHTTDDCEIQTFVDCCTTHALGVAKVALAAFTAYADACFHLRPPCPCSVDTSLLLADDGKSGQIDAETAVVTCQIGSCSTTLMP